LNIIAYAGVVSMCRIPRYAFNQKCWWWYYACYIALE